MDRAVISCPGIRLSQLSDHRLQFLNGLALRRQLAAQLAHLFFGGAP
jgi:hypothetical protein